MKNMINLTPHSIVLCGKEIASSGLARCEQKTETVGDIDGIRVNHKSFGNVYGLPEEQEGTIYIVSALVAQALGGTRADVFVVDETVRNEKGQIIGCNALAQI